MKHIGILVFVGICAICVTSAQVPPANDVVMVPTPAPPPTLGTDLEEIIKMIPSTQIFRLAARYLINDAEFQAFVRIINSNDAYITQMRFRSQPEVMSFLAWTRTQIMLSEGKFKLKIKGSDELVSFINRTPYWSNTVFGWQGFVNEFVMYYPEDMIRAHIQMKVAQNGIFTQFIQRLRDLKPVYDRVTAMPEAQRLFNALNTNGIDAAALDTFIRNQFGWENPMGAAPANSGWEHHMGVGQHGGGSPVMSKGKRG